MLDEAAISTHQSAMPHTKITLLTGHPRVVGSIGSADFARHVDVAGLSQRCDLVEIRLDLLRAQGVAAGRDCWRHLTTMPLLFTARRFEEGGALDLSAGQRSALLLSALDDAACIDVELASRGCMRELLAEAAHRRIPWIASFHDFDKLPSTPLLVEAAQRASAAGACAFKVAAKLNSLADIVRLAQFQHSALDLPLATMGMGALAPASRLLCAQCGSVLNYGYLGKTPTAPGQWDCGLLKQAISRSPQLAHPAMP